MDNGTMTWVLNARDETKAALASVKSGLGGVSSNIQNMQPAFKKMAFAGTAALGTIAAGFVDIINTTNEQIKQETQLNAVIASTKGAAGLTADEVKRMASELQNVTTVGDETILAGQNMLLSFTQIGKEVFPQATETLLDMATAMNNGATPSSEQLSSQAIQLGKALNDPVAGISALSRVGVKFTEDQKEMIKTMVEQGDVAGAQKVILDELSVEFGGRAREAAQTFEGQLTQLTNTIGDVKEEIGKQFIPVLIELVQKAKPVIDSVMEWIKQNPELTKNIVIGATAVAGLVAVVGALGIALGALMSPIGLIVAGLAVLGAQLYLVYTRWDDSRKKLIEMWGQISAYLKSAWDKIKAVFAEGAGYAMGRVQPLIDMVNRVRSLASGLGSAVGGFVSRALPGRAEGGPVSAGQAYIVGEKRPELFVPRTNGTIIPSLEGLGGGGNKTFNFTFNGDVTDRDGLVKMVVDAVNRQAALEAANRAW